MRYFYYAAAILILASGFAFAQSPAQQDSSQAAVQPVKADVEARLAAVERKLDQLENRVNAVLPADQSAPAAGMGDRLDALDHKLDLLEHNAKVKEGPTVTAGRNTFSIASPDQVFRVRIGGHMQLDGKTFVDKNGALDPTTGKPSLVDAFNLRRARPILEGNLGRYIDFRFVPDFGNGTLTLYDAYGDVKVTPYTILRGGRFKTPLGLEQLQNDADQTFIERSLATDLVPNRDNGFQLYADLFKNRLRYQVAAMNGAPDGANIDNTTHNGKDVIGRLFATPFAPSDRKLLKGLGFGMAASSGRQDEGALLPVYKSTGGQAAFFTYTGTAAVTNPITDGRRLSFSPQAYYYYGPFGVMAEYIDSAQVIGATFAKKTITREIDNHAWQVNGAWVLTGERKSYKSLEPRKGFEDGSSPKGFGAFELVARYNELTIDPTAFSAGFSDPTKSARAARAWCVGFNWYLNYFTKLQFDYDQTHFEQGALTGNRPTEHAIMQRLQIAF